MDEQVQLDRAELHSIAIFQKGILLCPEELRLILGLGVLALAIVSMVFVFLLAIRIYSTGVGIALGILTLIPLVGLIVLLVINGKATGILQRHGIQVGLLGASMRDFR